jgi:hypothetical protein
VLVNTVNNTLNRNALVNFIKKAILFLKICPSSTILRILCIVYVIQLSLKDLFSQLEVTLFKKNEIAKIQWSKSHI